jgi:Domain of unknown function (DUF4169)
MTATIINLRQVRKERNREREHGLAAEQRARFGRSKVDRTGEEHVKALHDARLDGARRLTDRALSNPDDQS